MSLYNGVVAAITRVQAELHEYGCTVQILSVEGGEVHIRLVAAAGT